MKLKLILAAFIAAVSIVPCSAHTFGPPIAGTAGSGSNESYLVVNFNDGANSSNNPTTDFVFGYLWNYGVNNSTPTGEDMLNAIADPTTGVPTFSFTQTTYSFGSFVDSFSFNGVSETADYNANGSYWAYFLSTGDRLKASNTDWDFASTGADGRSLTPGSVDAWIYSDNANGSTIFNPSLSPAPEASSAVSFGLLLCVGVAAFAFKVYHRHQRLPIPVR